MFLDHHAMWAGQFMGIFFQYQHSIPRNYSQECKWMCTCLLYLPIQETHVDQLPCADICSQTQLIRYLGSRNGIATFLAFPFSRKDKILIFLVFFFFLISQKKLLLQLQSGRVLHPESPQCYLRLNEKVEPSRHQNGHGRKRSMLVTVTRSQKMRRRNAELLCWPQAASTKGCRAPREAGGSLPSVGTPQGQGQRNRAGMR